MPTKTPEIIVFGDPEDRNITLRIIQSTRGGTIDGAPRRCIFDSTKHDVFISRNDQCNLHDTAGLNASGLKKNEAKDALISLYDFTGTLMNGVHLLVYVVRSQPSIENYKLFCKILFQNRVPIILITTEPLPPTNAEMPFKERLSLYSPIESPAEKEVEVQNILERHTNGPIWKPEDHTLWFAEAAWQSWDFLKDSTGWTINDCIVVLSQAMEQRHRLSKRLVKPVYDRITTHIKKNCLYNIIIFGSTGAGKTSLVNMLAGRELEPASDKAAGGTQTRKAHRVDIGGDQYILHDTVGLHGATNCEEATKSLSDLVRNVDGGVHLLVYVTNTRINDTDPKDYTFFHDGICLGQVPIVVAVTHVNPSKGDWWTDNEVTYKDKGMLFKDHACINAEGKKVEVDVEDFSDEGPKRREEYQCDKTSQEKVRKLLADRRLPKGWKIKDQDQPGRLGEVIQSVWQVFRSWGRNWKWKTYLDGVTGQLEGIGRLLEPPKLKSIKKK